MTDRLRKDMTPQTSSPESYKMLNMAVPGCPDKMNKFSAKPPQAMTYFAIYLMYRLLNTAASSNNMSELKQKSSAASD